MKAGTNESDVTTRAASYEEVQLLLKWAGDEGWNPGLDDARLFYSTHAAGFLVSTIGDHIVAGISLIKHSPDQSFLGLYLCSPEHRGQGVGMATWSAALTTIDQHTIGLDGVPDQQDNYRKSGFVYHFGNCRYRGVLSIPDDHLSSNSRNKAVHITRATQADTLAIIQYDAEIGGFERSGFFHAWLQSCMSRHTFIARKNDQIIGIIGARQCLDGYKVGPWLADSQHIALQLLLAASAVTDDAMVMIDVPDVNESSMQIATTLGLQPMFDTARMYKGLAPPIDNHRLFGVATLELG